MSPEIGKGGEDARKGGRKKVRRAASFLESSSQPLASSARHLIRPSFATHEGKVSDFPRSQGEGMGMILLLE